MFRAMVRAANPAAEEARPALVGKLFSVSILIFLTLCVCRKEFKNCEIFSSCTDFPLMQRTSVSLVEMVVLVVNLDKVIERLGVEGRFRSLLLLPQYFIRAMFGWAHAVVERVIIVRILLFLSLLSAAAQ